MSHKPIFLILYTFASLSLLCCTNIIQNNVNNCKYNISVTPIKPLLFNEDHNSEGFLITMEDGNIMLIFRLDPGGKGNHVGTNGYIAKIQYDPKNDIWGEVETVYNSYRYDDRNIHGGITKNGRIVVFFRHYDGKETEGRYFIYSDDLGKTWTELQKSITWSNPLTNNISGVWSTGHMFYNPDINKYIMFGCRRHITYSDEGSSWNEIGKITDNNDYKLSEIAGAWCKNNRMIVLVRDDVRELEHPLVQLETNDNGKSWSKPMKTNMPPKKNWGAAPQIIYDQKRDLLIALTSDRYSRANEKNSLFIYTAHPDDIFGNSTNWKLEFEILRPWAQLSFTGVRPLNQSFYGYPTIAPINENEYLIVFTERALMNDSEQADLYYFKLRLF